MLSYIVIAASRLTNFHDAVRVRAEDAIHALDVSFEHLHRGDLMGLHPMIDGVTVSQSQQWTFIVIEQAQSSAEQLRLIP